MGCYPPRGGAVQAKSPDASLPVDIFEKHEAEALKKFGTLAGVFTPTLLYHTRGDPVPANCQKTRNPSGPWRVIRESGRQRMGWRYSAGTRPPVSVGAVVSIWIPDQGMEWKLEMEFAELDQAILPAYGMMDRWAGELRVIAAVEQE